MALSDPLGDMLTRIRNGQMAAKGAINSPASKLRRNVLEVLQREGYIRGYEEVSVSKGIDELSIELKYHNGEPVIRELRRLSTPGRRVYAGAQQSLELSRCRGCRALPRTRYAASSQRPRRRAHHHQSSQRHARKEHA